MEPKTVKTLPSFITGISDVTHLLTELKAIDNNLLQLKIRAAGANVNLAKSSLQMEQLTNYYKVNLLKDEDRKELSDYLSKIKNSSPSIHMSFSADPSPQFLEKLVTWLRQNINPELLLNVGLQPTIAAGAIVRTTNKYFDFSLTENLKKNRKLLLEKIAGLQEETT